MLDDTPLRTLQIHGPEGIERMRAAGQLAAKVLEYAGSLVRVSEPMVGSVRLSEPTVGFSAAAGAAWPAPGLAPPRLHTPCPSPPSPTSLTFAFHRQRACTRSAA